MAAYTLSESEHELVIHGKRLYLLKLDIDSKDSNPKSPTLVFLHEGLGSVAQWRDFPHALCKLTGFNGLVYDREGYGKSVALTKPREKSYLEDEALKVLPSVLKACQLEKPILVGHSDGGSIAAIYAGAHPQEVVAIISEAAHFFLEDISIQGITEIKRQFEESNLKRGLRRYHGDKTETMFYGWADVWLNEAFRDWNLESYLDTICCPVLGIQGKQDEYGSKAQLDSLVKRCQGRVEIAFLDDCGHAPHHEKRSIILNLIADFLRQERLLV